MANKFAAFHRSDRRYVSLMQLLQPSIHAEYKQVV